MYSRSIARICLLCCVLFCLIPSFGFAQSRLGGASGETDRIFQPDMSQANASASQAPSSFATDNVVYPDFYYVGAGDVMSLEIVGPVSLTIPIVVSPENTILLPRLGEIAGAGKTLAQVRSEIQRLVQSRNPNNRAYLTLQRARTVYVRITGNVAQAGMYTLPASMRVSTAVQIANQETISTGAARQTTERKNTGSVNDAAPNGQYSIPFAQRNIKILHRNGQAEIADALRSRLTNDAASDPCLREGDEIYIPYEHEASEMVSVAGAVQRPCLVPFRKGDRISLLLKASYGLTENADSSAIQVNDVISAGNGAESARTLALRDILSGNQDLTLLPGMSVLVRQKEQTAKLRGTVSVLGEVKMPGMYAIDLGATRLKSILQQTGGFTKEAHLALSSITRRENKAMMLLAGNSQAGSVPTAEAMKNLQYTTLTPEDTLHFKMDEMLRRPVVACDIQAAMEKNSEADNVLLQDGDVIVIAANPKNVFVFGHVAKPGFVEFTAERGAEWYIQAAGNFAANADTSRTRIIKAKNRLWLEPRISAGVRKGETTIIEAGDQIYIPRVPDANSDLALKRAQAEYQREGLEVQKKQLEAQQQSQFWQALSAIVGLILAGLSVYGIFRQ
jgi:protein involved in polysaccharide export with SLBB domain